jgi:hypothetical protein
VKKLIAMGMVFGILFVTSGCGDSTPSKPAAPAGGAAPAPPAGGNPKAAPAPKGQMKPSENN